MYRAINKVLSALGISPTHELTPEQKLLLIQAFLAVMAILPFATWRFIQHQWLIGVIDLSVVLGMILLGMYGCTHGSSRFVSILLTFIYTSGAVAVAAIRGSESLFWAYPAVVACYFMIKTLEAVLISCFLLLALMAIAVEGLSDVALASFIVTYILVCMFASLFSTKMREDRFRLEKKATIDPLTGTNNRRALDDEIERIVSSVSRQHRPVSLLLFDIDHFKQINDQFGHAVGDTFLKEFVNFLLTQVRKHERLFRYGGEEFILLVEGPLGDASHLADKIREQLEQQQLIPAYTVTVSIGVAQLGIGESSREWVKRADDALYHAKRTGRNQVCVAQASHTWRDQMMDTLG